MTKLMCVSAQYCEAHLPLLFKILETSRDPIVRSNIVIGLGDIALSFSNMIDEVSFDRGFTQDAGGLSNDIILFLTPTEQRQVISRFG